MVVFHCITQLIINQQRYLAATVHLFFIVIRKIHHFHGLHNAIARMAHVRLPVTQGAVLILSNADAHRLGSWLGDEIMPLDATKTGEKL